MSNRTGPLTARELADLHEHYPTLEGAKVALYPGTPRMPGVLSAEDARTLLEAVAPARPCAVCGDSRGGRSHHPCLHWVRSDGPARGRYARAPFASAPPDATVQEDMLTMHLSESEAAVYRSNPTAVKIAAVLLAKRAGKRYAQLLDDGQLLATVEVV